MKWEVITRTILPSNLKVGDKIPLGTLTGTYTFTIVTMTDKIAIFESGNIQTIVVKNEDGNWQYNHWTRNKNSNNVLPIIYKIQYYEI